MELNFSTAFEEMISRVVDRCRSNYPGLGIYIQQWAHHVRRGLIHCQPTRTDQAGHFEPVSRTVILNQSLFNAFVGNHDGPVDVQALEATIHEFFHGTGANNLDATVHNSTERRQYSRCDLSYVDDRVTVITGLCLGSSAPAEATSTSAADRLFDRMIFCGDLDRGCAPVFTSRFNDPHLRTTPLPQATALSLCMTIGIKAYCRQTGALQTRQNVELQSLEAEMDRIATQRISGAMDRIPGTLLRVLGLQQQIETLWNTSSRCLGSFVRRTADGGLQLLRSSQTEPNLSPDNFFGWTMTEFLEQGGSRTTQCNLQMQSRVREFFTRLASITEQVRDSDLMNCFRATSRTRCSEQSVRDNLERFTNGRPIATEPVRLFFGEEFINRYSQALLRHHHLSPNFECQSTDRLTSVTNFIRFLMDYQSLQGRACPTAP